MKISYPLTLFLTFFILPFLSIAQQQKKTSKVHLIQQMNHYRGNDSSADRFFAKHSAQFQLAADSEMRKEKSAPGYNGVVHHRYRQYHQDIPVFGATYLLHEKNGIVEYANGYFRPLLDLNTRATISPEEALRLAQMDMKAKKYAWEMDFANSAFDYQKPEPQLCIVDPRFPHHSENVVLAYQLELHGWEPFDKQLYFVDAHTGDIHQKFSLLHENSVPAKAKTKYYGEQDIIVDSVGTFQFNLRDKTRGDGISTFDFNLNVFTNNSTNWDLTNADQDEVALDAHYCSEQFYDLLIEKYQWDGLDNNGEAMNTVVHANNGADFVNAYWDGELAWFGNGDCNNGPLTTMEVVGHEFTHGIIQRTSNLIYNSESGAINEHFADVMGKLLEYTADRDNFSWTLGRSFQYDTSRPPFRSLSDPASLNMPDFYKGVLWSDLSGVHTNSSVGNHFYYLMSEGESGTNEVGETYNIPAIGIETAAAIIFHTNRHYLTENSSYQDYYEASLQAAEELFGNGSTELDAVREAWLAVGLPSSGSIAIDYDLSIDVLPGLRFQNTCLMDEYIDLIFDISNVGTKDYYPAMGDQIEITTSSSNPIDLLYPLEDTLLAGQTIQVTISDAIFLTASEQVFTSLDLSVDVDENAFNNSSFSFIRNSIHLDNEVTISVSSSSYDCEFQQHALSLFLTNRSCNPLPQGTPITLSLEDVTGEEVWTKDLTIPFDLGSYSSYFLEETLTVSNWVSENYILKVTLEDDPVTSNNLRDLSLPSPKHIEGEYLNDFNSFNTYTEKMNAESYSSPPLVEYDGEQYFATSQRFSNPFQELCFLEDGNFNGTFGEFNLITGVIEGCLDLSEEDLPYVEFDLVQFRSDNDPDPTEQSSMIQFSWEGSDYGTRIIYGQEEGEVVHYEYALPPNFKGTYAFKFLNRRGGEVNSSDPAFLDQDINLIDNIHFTGIVVSTNEPQQKGLKLYPNPMTNLLYIAHAQDVKALQIINVQGQVLVSEKAYDGRALDLSEIAAGYYWLSSWNAEGEKTITPFVKLEP